MASQGICESLKSKRLGYTGGSAGPSHGRASPSGRSSQRQRRAWGLRPRPLVRSARPGSLPGPSRPRQSPPRSRRGTTRPRDLHAHSSLAPPHAQRGCSGGGGSGAGEDAGERKSAARRPPPIGCLALGPEAPPPWRGHVIPFKDGRPVVLMNNTWSGEGVRVGVLFQPEHRESSPPPPPCPGSGVEAGRGRPALGGEGLPPFSAGLCLGGCGVALPRGIHSAVEQFPPGPKGRKETRICWRKRSCCATTAKTQQAWGTRRAGDRAP